MPHFSKEEREVLIPLIEDWAKNAKDENARRQLTRSLKRLQDSDRHHAAKDAEGRKA
ncbi:hypothetical protein [Microvirga mediterraneensis]|uniref:Uncharacterized protein n=1 Tax=Microvirga mediterraneensis TaxID=2754695 RepID=A0A838BQI5_9HYPH|nr:hypothetical protein [Microvirga mediterraneensis]MBA1157797.1 hypothetical protein [Microvirga mediterraneensis]